MSVASNLAAFANGISVNSNGTVTNVSTPGSQTVNGQMTVNGIMNANGFLNWSSAQTGTSFLGLPLEPTATVGSDHILGSGAVSDLLAFNPPSVSEIYNGSSWATITTLGNAFTGKNSMAHGGVYNQTLASGVNGGWRWTWNSFGYRFWDMFLISGNTQANNLYLTIEASSNGSAWTTQVSNLLIGGTWPGYNYARIPNLNNSGYSPNYALRITITYTSTGTGVGINNVSLFGAYGGATPLFTWDQSRNIAFPAAISKGSGSFKIDHPLPELSKTHYLVHSFTESPQADLLYSGSATLDNGKVEINIDTDSGMTEGTFEALCRNVRVFTTNESDWDPIKGSVAGNILTITSKNSSATSDISWLVIGERQDPHMYKTDWTGKDGRVIVEPKKPTTTTLEERPYSPPTESPLSK